MSDFTLVDSGVSRKSRKWSDAFIENEIRRIASGVGHFPSVSELRSMGRNDLSCIISKSGGFLHWSDKLNIDRVHSDSDTGWDGEQAVMQLFATDGHTCVRSTNVKFPFDLLVADVLRVDVKSARYAEYGACRGWFYRIGKIPQADLIVLYQLDTGNFCGLPWFLCPRSNVTIARDGGKYKSYLNNWQLIREMIARRQQEVALHCVD